jgi:secreted trypsin-like serine protease
VNIIMFKILNKKGATSLQVQKPSDIKRESRQKIRSDKFCATAYTTFRFNPNFQVCSKAYTGQGGACVGDSGGPVQLLNSNDGKWYVIGLVSFGTDCLSGTIYTKISAYFPWIKQNML